MVTMHKVNITQEFWTFSKSPRYRISQEEHGWDAAMRRNGQTGTRRSDSEDGEVRVFAIFFQLFSSTVQAIRFDYRASVALKIHLYRNAEEYQKPIPHQDQDRVREGNKFSETYRHGVRVDKKIGWRFWTSSSSWWKSGHWDWKEYSSSFCGFYSTCFLL